LKNMDRRMPRKSGTFDLDALLNPARAFACPADVVNDADLTLVEKRAILSSWASGVCSVEASGTRPAGFDDIMDALRALDRQVPYRPRPHYRRVLEQRTPGVFGRKSRDDDRDQPLN
jgi:hypothetical protein